MVDVVLTARTQSIGDMVQACADGDMSFDDLCSAVAAMGFKTTSLYEMVRAAEQK
jgi:hypothetical protein